MKINNKLANPTVIFHKLRVGDVFMTFKGDVFLKTHPNISTVRHTGFQAPNAFCFNLKNMQTIDENAEVVPVEAELTMLKNTYEQYHDR